MAGLAGSGGADGRGVGPQGIGSRGGRHAQGNTQTGPTKHIHTRALTCTPSQTLHPPPPREFLQPSRPEEAARAYGRHFDHNDELVSRISRKSINVLKAMFRDDLSKDDWRLVVKLKKTFKID